LHLYAINLEEGLPTVETARRKLEQAMRTARARRFAAMKIIHGYGSTGKGGAIKRDVQAYLSVQKRRGHIQNYVPGESFSPFDENARLRSDRCPDLARDSDYSRGHDGVTLVLL
jgi:hypothetical protein